MKKNVCDKCGQIMQRHGSLIMSNSRYEIWKCAKCNVEKKICVGLL